MADRIVAMNDGVVQQVGTPLELYDDPANIFVAGFIGSPAMNFLDATARAEGDVITLDVGAVAIARVARPAGLADGAALTVGARPERVTLSTEGAAARVDLIEPTGLGTVIHLLVGGQDLKLFTTDRPKLALGDMVHLTIAPSDIRLFDKATGARLRPAP